MTQPEPGASRSIPPLDGWRAIAVLWVCGYHGNLMLFKEGGLFASVYLQNPMTQGYLGVDLFFGISGFLITTLMIQEAGQSGSIDWVGFYRRRAFRIFPAAWFFLLVTALLDLAGLIPALSQTELASSLFFWRNYDYTGRATGHFWSLAVEEHFYFLWPAMFLLVRDRVRLLKLSVGIALAVAVWREADTHYQIAHSFFPSIQEWKFRTDHRIDGILWGCIVALALPGIPKRPAPWSWQLLAVGSVVLFATLCYFKLPFARLGLGASIAALVASTVLGPTTILGKFLEIPALRFIGCISFSLYLWQQLFLYVWPHVPERRDNYTPGFVAAMIAGMAVCALGSYYFIEQPMIRFGRRWRNLASFSEGNQRVIPKPD